MKKIQILESRQLLNAATATPTPSHHHSLLGEIAHDVKHGVGHIAHSVEHGVEIIALDLQGTAKHAAETGVPQDVANQLLGIIKIAAHDAVLDVKNGDFQKAETAFIGLLKKEQSIIQSDPTLPALVLGFLGEWGNLVDGFKPIVLQAEEILSTVHIPTAIVTPTPLPSDSSEATTAVASATPAPTANAEL